MNKMFFLLRIGCFLGIICYLSACSPIYNNVIDLTPPQTESGLQCIAECEKSQRACLLAENREYMNCRSNEFFYRRTLYAHPRSLYHYNHIYYYSPYRYRSRYLFDEFCTVNRQQCKQDYLACYQACGGNIQTHQECALFCDDE